RIVSNSIAFVAGFSAVFVALGASATTVGDFLQEQHSIFNIVAGVIIIIFGLHLTGLIKIPFLYREAKVNTGAPKRGLIGAFLLGFAFAFGWRPCIGPILAAILARAATKQNLDQGMCSLRVYAGGVPIAFLVPSAALS